MVRIIRSNSQELYQCEECGFHYEDTITAERCEAWCREHKSCNIEITSHARENKSMIQNKHGAHYVCLRGCKGVSSVPGVCQAPDCAHHHHELVKCPCTDGRHFDFDRKKFKANSKK